VLLCEGMMVVLTLRLSLCLLRHWRIGVSVSSALDARFGRFIMCGLQDFFHSLVISHLSNSANSQFNGVLEFLAEPAHDGSECDTLYHG
jgi:hypothetical protein